ncbi:MAG TPA: oligosaccharyl transferase, archaeosortase A system-associated [Methanocorpusculum sp.]|nr:oligosaccharyl transferase, archaeosortase A system-associated [Methanocorpusculum sp.]HJK79915.1 oligosaccharyl transferase, archaeosortase A system-associated [Methanocorpusculum sp.]
MDLSFWNDRRYRYGILGGLVLIFTVLAFWIRILPFPDLAGTGDMIAGPDAWYNLRLIEVALANNFGYIHFEPMTLYPTGQDIVWGPLFTWIAAAVAALAGAVTRPEVIDAAGWVPALMGAAMVPVMYWLGARLGNWKTGLVSALFIAVIGGQYLSRSLYGHLDHHIAETLFSTLFCLLYVVALYALKDHKIDFKEYSTLKIPVLYGVICGIAYLLGLLTMSTMVVFGLFAAIFTLIQFIINHHSGKPTEYLLVLNVITFAVVTIGMLIYGIQNMSFSFYSYSLGVFCAHLGVIASTIVLYAICRIFSNKEMPWYYFPASLVILVVLVMGITAVGLPSLYNAIIGSFSGFFLQSVTGTTVAEMASWSIQGAFNSFGWGILLAAGGFIYLLYRVWKHEEPGALFVLIWSALMIFATMQHVRWEYYVAANIALLAAVFVGWAITFAEKDLLQIAGSKKQEESEDKPAKKGKKAAAKAAAGPDWIKVGTCAIVAVIAIAFVATSAVTAVQTGESYGKYGGTEKDWISECTWMLTGTPETGVDYLTIYNGEGFEYPSESYGVMSWWDYGHYITTIAERIPNSNPFQSGVAGPYGAAAVLTSTNESAVMEKLDHLGTRYVMTDYQMAGGKFGAMAIWNDSVAQLTPYYYTFLQPNNSGQLSGVQAQTPEYYNTLTVRLQYYDGSMTSPGDIAVVETDSSANYSYPVITAVKAYATEAEAQAAADLINAAGPATKHAYVIANPSSTATAYLPSTTVPALQHFRLVHESPNYVMANGQYTTQPIAGGTAWVKSFEYVPGAVIKGDGIIEVNVVTNNGRTFTYRQASVDGQFVVPYSTSGSSYDVKTTGPYTIAGTGETFEVSEEAVMRGLTIN